MSGKLQRWGLSPASASSNHPSNSNPPSTTSPQRPSGASWKSGQSADTTFSNSDTSTDRISASRIHAPLPMNPNEAESYDAAKAADTSYASSSSSSRPGSSDGISSASFSGNWHMTPIQEPSSKPPVATASSASSSAHAEPLQDSSDQHAPGFRSAMRHARQFYSSLRRNVSDGSETPSHNEDDPSTLRPPQARRGGAFWRSKLGTNTNDAGDAYEEDPPAYSFARRYPERVAVPSTRHVSAPQHRSVTANSTPSMDSEPERHLQRTDSEGSRKSLSSSIASNTRSQSGSVPGSRELPADVIQAVTASIGPMHLASQQEALEAQGTSPETSRTQSESSVNVPSTLGQSPPAVAAPALVADVPLKAMLGDSHPAASRAEISEANTHAVDSSLSPTSAAPHNPSGPMNSSVANVATSNSNSTAASSVAPRPSLSIPSSATNTYDIASQRSPNRPRNVPPPPSDPSTDSKRALFLRARTKSVDHFQRLLNITKHGSKDAHRSNTKKLRKPEAARAARVPSEPRIPENTPIESTGLDSGNPAPIEEASSETASSAAAANATVPELHPSTSLDHPTSSMDSSIGSLSGSQLYGAAADGASQTGSGTMSWTGAVSQAFVPRTPLYDASSSMSYFDLPSAGAQSAETRTSPVLQRSTPISSQARRTPSNASANARASPKRNYANTSPSVTRSASGSISPTATRDLVWTEVELMRSGSTGTQSTHTVHSARSNPIDESSPPQVHSNEEVAAQIEHMLTSSMPTQTAHDAKQSIALHTSESPETMLWNDPRTDWDELAADSTRTGSEIGPDKSQGLLEGLCLDQHTTQPTTAEEIRSPASAYSQLSSHRPTAGNSGSQSKPLHSSSSSDTKDEIVSRQSSRQRSLTETHPHAVTIGNHEHSSPTSEELWWPISHTEDDQANVAPRTPNMRLQRHGSAGRYREPLSVKIPPSMIHPTGSNTSPFTLDRPATASSIESHTQFPSSSSGTSSGPTMTQAWSHGKSRGKSRTNSQSPSLHETNSMANMQETPSRRATEELLSVTPTIIGPQSASPLRHHWEHDVEDDEPQTMVPKSMLRPSKSSSLLNAMAHPAQRSKAKKRPDWTAPMPAMPVPSGPLTASGFLDANYTEDENGSCFGPNSLMYDDTQDPVSVPAYLPPPLPPPPSSLRRKGRLDHSPPLESSLTSHKSAVDLRSAVQLDTQHAHSSGTISSHPSTNQLSNSVGFSGTPSVEPPLYRTKRNKSQPTLRIADDHEFLQALEQVRSQHQKRIALRAQARTARKASMPNLRQTSPVMRKITRTTHTQPLRTSSAASGPMREEEEDAPSQPSQPSHVPSSNKDANDTQDLVEPSEEQDMSQDQNSSSFLDLDTHSAHGSDAASLESGASDTSVSRANLQDESQSMNKAWDRDVHQDTESIASSESSLNESIANELGIGQATGNTPSKPFTNDADWKKEVKALFLIRELVQTERSYARHLESLLIVVLKWTGTTSTSTRMQTNVLMPSLQPVPSSSRMPSGNAPPPHLLTLRKMLPQLISLSRALVYRIEESPSSVGVAHAFLVIRDQLEEVHVAWSKVVSGTLRALRITESSKSRAKGRLGLVPVLDAPHSEISMPFRRSASRDDSDISDANLEGSSDRRPDPRIKPVTKEKELSPVDVAIMPTQRIPRYCLLLRDLLSNTNPDSPSYATLQTALQNVQELGRLCDEASSKT
ncbi:hypothetical protein MYAM1_000043 [Malassezia yamatoensis]|uniref:DH domain-containing protein n=1 Tax=Malassezia yamatoensis TaxID=253288 RepID=A0AAJ6CG68_9BASI|nr:hypothetical protein MYAM1_000043 [Malassezia yamatoensis]